MADVFITGDIKVTVPITEEDYIKKILWWIIFTTEEQRKSNNYDSINYFSDIIMFIEKDFSNLSTDFSRRTQAIGKIHFGMRRSRRIKAILHWVKYLYCISGHPTIVYMNEVMFI